jgi:hypothetical protein
MLTFDISNTSINFLDVIIFKNESRIMFKVYQKPLNKYSYIPNISSHPRSLLKGWITGEFVRYIRLSSQLEDFEYISSLFFQRLEKRGYSKFFINKVRFSEKIQKFVEKRYNLPTKKNPDNPIFELGALSRLQSIRTKQNLTKNFTTNRPQDKMYFVIRFSNQPEISEWFRLKFQELSSQILTQMHQPIEFKTSFSRNKNLLQIVSSSSLDKDQIKLIDSFESEQVGLEHTEISSISGQYSKKPVQILDAQKTKEPAVGCEPLQSTNHR